MEFSSDKEALTLAFLGWAGSIFIVVLGSQASIILWAFATPAAVAFLGVYVLSAGLLVSGSFLIMKGQTHLGAFLNISAGLIMLNLYVYYEFFSTPIFLQFGTLNVALFLPALASGALAFLRKNRPARPPSPAR